jgi:hypothetical protein
MLGLGENVMERKLCLTKSSICELGLEEKSNSKILHFVQNCEYSFVWSCMEASNSTCY